MTPRVLIDEATLKKRVGELAAEIAERYRGKELTVVVILKGAFVFAADLVRRIDAPVIVDFLGVRSYGDASVSSGIVQITTDLSYSIQGKDVLVVEDIVDTGLTVAFLWRTLLARQPRSLALAALLHKPARAQVEVDISYLGFTIEDVFVVGYGLDYRQQYRNLPCLAVLSEP